MLKNKIISAVLSGFLLFSSSLTAYAEVTLPEGTVAGLPEKLSVLDSEGASPNDKGEYFFEVEAMVYGEPYTKNIQVTNLREDKAYHIYFYAEPLEKSGEIDLESECDCVMTLNGNEVYRGDVNGKGNIDLTVTPLDLGSYAPGDSRTLSCTITWDRMPDIYVDEGHVLKDHSGEYRLRDKNGDGYVEGEVTFKWIFYAVVDEEFEPPKTGLTMQDGGFWLWCIAISAATVVILLILIFLKRKKKAENK